MYVAAHKGLAGKSAAKVLQIMRKKGSYRQKMCKFRHIAVFYPLLDRFLLFYQRIPSLYKRRDRMLFIQSLLFIGSATNKSLRLALSSLLLSPLLIP